MGGRWRLSTGHVSGRLLRHGSGGMTLCAVRRTVATITHITGILVRAIVAVAVLPVLLLARLLAACRLFRTSAILASMCTLVYSKVCAALWSVSMRLKAYSRIRAGQYDRAMSAAEELAGGGTENLFSAAIIAQWCGRCSEAERWFDVLLWNPEIRPRALVEKAIIAVRRHESTAAVIYLQAAVSEGLSDWRFLTRAPFHFRDAASPEEYAALIERAQRNAAAERERRRMRNRALWQQTKQDFTERMLSERERLSHDVAPTRRRAVMIAAGIILIVILIACAGVVQSVIDWIARSFI